MNQQLQTLLDFIQQNEKITAEEKDILLKAIKKADSDMTISEFGLSVGVRTNRNVNEKLFSRSNELSATIGQLNK